MKIAVTARGSHPFSEVDESFGRAYWFVIYETREQLWSSVDNTETRNAQEHAGVKAAKILLDHGVKVLLTGETGPKAFRSLTEMGITVFHGASGLVEDTLHAWQRGELIQADHPNSQGSPYCLVVQQTQQPPLAPKVLQDLFKTH